jgi:hypothetical protein
MAFTIVPLLFLPSSLLFWLYVFNYHKNFHSLVVTKGLVAIYLKYTFRATKYGRYPCLQLLATNKIVCKFRVSKMHHEHPTLALPIFFPTKRAKKEDD